MVTTLERGPDGSRAAGTGWRLHVFGDGSAAEFVNFAAVERSHALSTDPAWVESQTNSSVRAKSSSIARCPRLLSLDKANALSLN